MSQHTSHLSFFLEDTISLALVVEKEDKDLDRL